MLIYFELGLLFSLLELLEAHLEYITPSMDANLKKNKDQSQNPVNLLMVSLTLLFVSLYLIVQRKCNLRENYDAQYPGISWSEKRG
jgi:hypothetical protein